MVVFWNMKIILNMKNRFYYYVIYSIKIKNIIMTYKFFEFFERKNIFLIIIIIKNQNLNKK